MGRPATNIHGMEWIGMRAYRNFQLIRKTVLSKARSSGLILQSGLLKHSISSSAMSDELCKMRKAGILTFEKIILR